MFKSLKDKLKGWFKKAESEAVPIAPVIKKLEEPSKPAKPTKKVKIPKTKEDLTRERDVSAKVLVDIKNEGLEIKTPEEKFDELISSKESVVIKKEKKGFFKSLGEKFTHTKISEDYFTELFDALELILLENNVALSVVDSIRDSLKESLVGKEFRKSEIKQVFSAALRGAVDKLLLIPDKDIIELIKDKAGVFVVVFLGINGSGKTTTLAKFAHLLKNHGISSVFAAGDTFRAASMEQLLSHGNALDIRVIKQSYGSDPAAVAFDAIQYAKAHNIKCVLIDTAGRMHTKDNLMAELIKIVRVAKPDFKFFVGESITGNDATLQAEKFNDAVGIDGIILTKAEVDVKGGTALSVSKVTGRPLYFLGTGQGYDSLEPFNKEKLLKALGL